jgi:hypothetical protein
MQWIFVKSAFWMLTIADHPMCKSKKSAPVVLPAVAQNTGTVAYTWKGTALKGTTTSDTKGTVQCMVFGRWNFQTVD